MVLGKICKHIFLGGKLVIKPIEGLESIYPVHVHSKDVSCFENVPN